MSDNLANTVNAQQGRAIAVLIPCYNEETTIHTVIRDFKSALPTATVYVYDNNSNDRTVERAREEGAITGTEAYQGKGNVVRRMFADIDADIYVLVDGDDTYNAPDVNLMIETLIAKKLDMVVGTRTTEEKAAYRMGHRFGNALLTGLVGQIFGRTFSDMLSGYRVFSRRYVKSFPALSTGFETETELTVHALELRMPTGEISTPYRSRPENSSSKLNTYRDGVRILMTIVRLFKFERPLAFFSITSSLLAAASLVLAYPLIVTYLEIGQVPRFPTAILATGLMLLAFLSLASGLILDTVTRGRHEIKRLFYLANPPINSKS
jgi:glycosyltransferase involved in cell wall biosynthesis